MSFWRRLLGSQWDVDCRGSAETRQNISFQLTSGQNLGRRSDPGELIGRYRVSGDRRIAEFFLQLFLQKPKHTALPRLMDYLETERKRLKTAFYSDTAIEKRLARGVAHLVLTLPEFQLA